jgi:uncharacterized protein YndB with AHSA1/START domain
MVQSNHELTVSLPSDREIVMVRDFDAPRQLVYEAFTRPEHMARWWGPHGYTTPVCEMDLRPGGKYRFVQRNPAGEEFAFRGEYREVDPPAHFSATFEFEGMPGHVCLQTTTLEEIDGKTRLTARMLFDTPEDRDGMLQSGMEHGARESYERLDDLLRMMSEDRSPTT